MGNNFISLVNHQLGLIIIIVILTYVIYKIMIPYIIIFKKDYSRIYQDFFVKEIKKMLIYNKRFFLIIEDIDRLQEDEALSVFRTISNINSSFLLRENILGLLSYDDGIFEFSTQGKRIYDDLENKLVLDNVESYYDPQQSMITYFTQIHDFIIKEYELRGQSDDIIKVLKKLDGNVFRLINKVKGFNFRDLKRIISIINQNYYEIVENEEEIIDKINMVEKDVKERVKRKKIKRKS
ncbi:hypothetical protein [Breznakia pachnodae]|uniref:KAP NTPase domain-containing protein n=1 Tax=Breznakia pachnodae TaxID=265178 RepID=A0ABU0E4J9_9FIRM|nr:hypothetical protein [Breznakia pachnodae]MDQ0361654.1 hypothetical protein [Breznakia pachnodae]